MNRTDGQQFATRKVSVVMCTYNGSGRHLREQMESILHQTYPLYEIVVQDDGSTDSTMAMLAEFSARDSRVKVFCNESGRHGINANFYSAMRRATGDFIAISDQDDLWEPYKIEEQMRAIGDKMLCGGRSEPFSDDGSFVHVDPRRPNVTLLRMLCCAEIAGHTMLIRREMLERLPSDCAVVTNRCYDIVLSVMAAASDSLVYVDRVLVHQRRYASSATYTSDADSVPTASNAFHMLLWSVRHYRRVKHLAAPGYNEWEEFLLKLNAPTSVCREGVRFMRLMQSAGVGGWFRLTLFCLRHRNEIFHTRKSFAVSVVRALLFPFTSCWYQRFLILSKK